MTPLDQRAVPTRPLFWRLMLLCLTFSFLTQSLVVQTHFHGGPISHLAGVAHISNSTPPNPGDPYDPENCPLCQEMLDAGSYVLPVIVGIIVGLTAVPYLPVFILLPHPAAARHHNWQSRAPPRR